MAGQISWKIEHGFLAFFCNKDCSNGIRYSLRQTILILREEYGQTFSKETTARMIADVEEMLSTSRAIRKHYQIFIAPIVRHLDKYVSRWDECILQNAKPRKIYRQSHEQGCGCLQCLLKKYKVLPEAADLSQQARAPHLQPPIEENPYAPLKQRHICLSCFVQIRSVSKLERHKKEKGHYDIYPIYSILAQKALQARSDLEPKVTMHRPQKEDRFTKQSSENLPIAQVS